MPQLRLYGNRFQSEKIQPDSSECCPVGMQRLNPQAATQLASDLIAKKRAQLTSLQNKLSTASALFGQGIQGDGGQETLPKRHWRK